MVNEKRIKDKIPELLADGPLTIPENLYKYQTDRKRIRKLERKNPFILRPVLQGIKEQLEAMQKLLDQEV